LYFSHLNISIDSLNAETSDLMRGRPGHTERTLASLFQILEEIKRQRNSHMKVYLKAVVCGANVRDLVPMVEFAQEHGIAGVTFQPLEAVFSRHQDFGDDWFKHTPLWPEDPEPLADVSAQLAEMKRNGAPIMNPASHIDQWGAYFRDPLGSVQGQIGGDNLKQDTDGRVERVPCRVGHSHLYLNSDGAFKLCWSFPTLGDAKVDSIPKKWNSHFAEQQRDDIANCTATCTKTCLLDRGLAETAKTFFHLMKHN
jgi:MoaA/NifB/PqqE/SkfB family radical SAM enzyme